VDWLRGLPGPVAAAHEAGPTGFGLARAVSSAGIRCVVAAPSKIVRAPGDRVRTVPRKREVPPARDAMLLARLLRKDDLVEVRVPSVAQVVARDLVRAREDVRGDLMRACHRLSKLLLRHGHVYPPAFGRGCPLPAVRRGGTPVDGEQRDDWFAP